MKAARIGLAVLMVVGAVSMGGANLADAKDPALQMLIEHDKTRATHKPATDQLREAAAAHYGGMVTMCVSCHNRFRPLARP